MLAVVEDHGDAFDAVNVATAMHRVAKLQPPNADLVTQAPLFSRLTGETLVEPGDCCAECLLRLTNNDDRSGRQTRHIIPVSTHRKLRNHALD